jgi:hypothetical protein
MRTTATITDSAYRSFVEFRVKRKKGVLKGQTITHQVGLRLFYIMVLFPGAFFLVSHFFCHMGLVAATVIALVWFLSFLIAGVLYHRSVVGVVTRRPSDPDLDQPREYAIEGDWLVIRTPDTESRMSLRGAVDLVVTPIAAFLVYERRQPVFLPFGSASDKSDQVAFLDGLRRLVARPEEV